MDITLSENGLQLKKKIGVLLNEYHEQGVSAEEICEILKEKYEFAKFVSSGD